MPQILPLTQKALPDGIGDTPLDAAHLVARMRELYRSLRFKAETAQDEAERQLCYRLMHEIEQVIEGHGHTRRVWEAARADLVREVVAALRGGADEHQ